MFEFSIALRYLLPKRRALSTSLIALLSVGVISVVVWLLLVFLSVTTGMEKNWLEKLTSLYAPIRISPTEEYYHSYYYNIDQIASNSDFQLKSIGEKSFSSLTDPYKEEEDRQLPSSFPKPDRTEEGSVKDPVKELFSSLESSNTHFQDFEVSAALMKLIVAEGFSQDMQVLSQMSYLLSFNAKNPQLKKLLVSPRICDLNYLIKNIDNKKDLNAFFIHSYVEKILVDPELEFTLSQLALKKETLVLAQDEHLIFSDQEKALEGYQKKKLTYKDGVYFLDNSPIDSSISLSFDYKEPIKAFVLYKENNLTTTFTDKGIELKSSYFPFTIAKASPRNNFSTLPQIPPLWVYYVEKEGCFFPDTEKTPILLPKAYQSNGMKIKMNGELGYKSSSVTSIQEQKIDCEVIGFYDPGIMPMGSRMVLVPFSTIKTINGSTSPIMPDDTPANGIFVWPNSLDNAQQIKEQITASLKEKNISKYWKIDTYKDYLFAKDLLQQFQSDRTLFTLIGIIILFVACCNIISLLIMLVSDKKKEIALLQALGAKRKSIGLIFGFCGIILGTLGAIIGSSLAILTLKKIDYLINFLNMIQGHQAFNPAFFGEKLPSALSVEALVFICVATPIIALIAGLIPAIKASRIQPAKVLRSP